MAHLDAVFTIVERSLRLSATGERCSRFDGATMAKFQQQNTFRVKTSEADVEFFIRRMRLVSAGEAKLTAAIQNMDEHILILMRIADQSTVDLPQQAGDHADVGPFRQAEALGGGPAGRLYVKEDGGHEHDGHVSFDDLRRHASFFP